MVPRLPLFAAIGVREIWRWTGVEMEFLRLTRGRKYEKIQHSLAFPFITAADVTRFLKGRDARKPIGVAEYRLTDALPPELKSSLPTIEQLQQELKAANMKQTRPLETLNGNPA